MITIDKKIFEEIVLSATSSSATVFESLGDRIAISTSKLKSRVFGSVIDIDQQSAELTKECIRFICMDSFYDAIPMLDLVLTPTGFGVVNNQNVSPASQMRVEALRKLVRRCADDAMDSIIDLLIGDKTWAESPYASLLINSLYYSAHQLRDYAGKPDASRADLFAMRPMIAEAEELIYRTISADFFTYLLKKLRLNALSDDEILIVHTLRQAIGFYLNKQDVVFRREIDGVVNTLESNLDRYPVYRDSLAYRVKHFEFYKNEKEDSCYFWG